MNDRKCISPEGHWRDAIRGAVLSCVSDADLKAKLAVWNGRVHERVMLYERPAYQAGDGMLPWPGAFTSLGTERTCIA